MWMSTRYSVAAMVGIIICCGIGCWPAAFTVAAETSTLELRSKTSGIGWLLGGIIQGGFGLGTPQFYNPDAANLGAKTGFIFAGTSALGVLFTYFFIPELKGKSAVEIDRVFQKYRGSVRRAPTSEWERVDSMDKLDPTESNGQYSTASRSTSNAEPVDTWEPLRKRPTY
jgi:hypothetical protein